ncbi:D-alanyl-D-alanine carboxypeptidase family protein [Psychrobacter aestuarii]
MASFRSACLPRWALLVAVGVSSTLSAQAVITPPDIDASAYVLMDYNTGEILAQKNANTPLPPASLTKMMTSYLIEQRLNDNTLRENDAVLMSERAWCRGSSSQSCMYVPVNETASVIDMLRGIIIQSGNDASKAMAEHLAGDEASFADLMNEEANKLGMTQSHFVNATGMPETGHVASARDLAILARAIIKNSGDYYPLYAEPSFTYNGITQGNRNALLLTDSSVDGLKTGHTSAAGYCLAASSKREQMRLISVILGSKSAQSRADDSRALLNWGFGHFVTEIKASKGQAVTEIPVRYGTAEQVAIVTNDTLQVLTTKAAAERITTVLEVPEHIEAPIALGQPIGRLVAVMDGQAVAAVPVVASAAVTKTGWFSTLWQRLGYWLKAKLQSNDA